MTDLTYILTGDGDEANIAVFVPGHEQQTAHSSHPNFAAIVEGARAGDASILDLFDIAKTAGTIFARLSDRVTTAYGRLYLDGEEVADELTGQVLRFLDSGVEDWKPLVAFFEKVQANPNEHSRRQLYSWLAADSFTIAEDGDVIGYKGVATNDADSFESINHGKAIVDGTVHSGAIPNRRGAVVEMPRSEVTFDPATGCSRGLHVGTWGYAHSFSRGAVLEVRVNPRDVVSVPTDCSAQKMRVCRYRVVDSIAVPYTEPVEYDYDEPDEWGDGDDDDDEGSW